MSTIVSYNGVSYTIPDVGEEGWGGTTKVDGLLVSLATNSLQKAGGLFTLTSDIDFGGVAGLKVSYVKGRGTVSTTGIFRMSKTDFISWRDNANSQDLELGIDTSDNLTFNGVIISSSAGVIPVTAGGTGITSYTTGDMLYASAATTLSKRAIGTTGYALTVSGGLPVWAVLGVAGGGTGVVSYTAGDIPYASAPTTVSKLAIGATNFVLTSNGTSPGYSLLVNANIDNAAAIAFSKFAALASGNLLVGSAGNVATSVAVTGDVLISNTGVTSINTGVIVDADINASAGITRSKLASGSNDHVLINSAAGVMTSEAALSPVRGGTGIANNAAATLTRSGNHAITLTTTNTTSVTLPTAGTLATLAGAEVLTNKDYDGGTASNTSRFTFAKDTLANIQSLTRKEGTVWYASDVDKLYKDDGATLTEIGSGSGAINYIGNPDAEASTSGWNTPYADAAGVAPVDGTGGSANITWTRVTSAPIRGAAMFRLTKDAANRRGEGVSYDFTIANADKAKPLQISAEYAVSAAAVAGSDSATGDVNFYIVADPAGTPTVIQPTPFKLTGGTGNNWKYSATFQTLSNVTSYRLCIHLAGTNAAAATYDFDSITVSPQVQLYGSAISDWTTYTPTFTGLGTVASVNFKWRRVGNMMEVLGSATAGTVTAADVTVTLPTGYSVDSTQVLTTGTVVGVASNNRSATAGTANLSLISVIDSLITSVAFTNIADGATRNLDAVQGSTVFANASPFAVDFAVPITGWGSNIVMSQDADTRIIACSYAVAAPTASAFNGTAALIFGSGKEFDTHNAYNTTTGVYTAPIAGYYRVSGSCNITGTEAADARAALCVFKNGVRAKEGKVRLAAAALTETICQVNALVQCVAGDTLDVRIDTSIGAPAVGSDINTNYVQFERVTGPSVVAASEKISMRAAENAAQTITNNTATIVKTYGTVVYDSHGAFTGNNKFTAPMAGVYRISVGGCLATGGGWGAGEEFSVRCYKNGSVDHYVAVYIAQAAHTTAPTAYGATEIKLLAGDYIEIRYFQNSGADIASINDAKYNWVTISSQ